jgi:hypothetical protein
MTPGELGARAFEKVWERNPVFAKAETVIKATFAEELLSGGMPVLVVGGPDAMHEAIDDTESSEAYKQLQELGRRQWPTASEAQQFARAFTAPANAALAAKAHRRPAPNEYLR